MRFGIPSAKECATPRKKCKFNLRSNSLNSYPILRTCFVLCLQQYLVRRRLQQLPHKLLRRLQLQCQPQLHRRPQQPLPAAAASESVLSDAELAPDAGRAALCSGQDSAEKVYNFLISTRQRAIDIAMVTTEQGFLKHPRPGASADAAVEQLEDEPPSLQNYQTPLGHPREGVPTSAERLWTMKMRMFWWNPTARKRIHWPVTTASPVRTTPSSRSSHPTRDPE
jgi:hypothetical protein